MELEAAPDQAHEQGRAGETKPDRLVVSRRDGKLELRAFLVPDAVVVGRLHEKAKLARLEVRIERLPPIAGLLPLVVMAFQPVTELHALRIDEAQRGEFDRDVADQRGQAQAIRD